MASGLQLKGFIDGVATSPADIICIQESKAAKEDIIIIIRKAGYSSYWFSAQKGI